MIVVAAIVGTCLAASWPLIDAVYTDLVARARRGKKHVMGMSAAMFGCAYIIGPILAGFLTEQVGGARSFAVIGALVVIVALTLLYKTPPKLALPQTEMIKWD